MSNLSYGIAATLAACLVAGVVAAQSPPPGRAAISTGETQRGESETSNAAMQALVDAALATPSTTASATLSSTRDVANAPQVISSPPAPDITANRTRFGAPLSRAGRLTRAAGN